MKKQRFEVYKIQNNLTGKYYVGATVRGINERFRKHKNDYDRGRKTPLYLDFNKYGVDNFSINILESCSSQEHLEEREIFWIKTLDATNPQIGYNLTLGGKGSNGRVISQESKEAYINSRNSKGVTVFTKKGVKVEVIKSLFKFCTKYKITYKGFMEKINGANDIVILDRDFNIKIDRKGFKLDVKIDPTPLDVRMKNMQEKSKLYNRSTPEAKEKARRGRAEYAKPIAQYNKETGELIGTYGSARQAEELTGVSRGAIRGCIKGTRSEGKGFIWKFVEAN